MVFSCVFIDIKAHRFFESTASRSSGNSRYDCRRFAFIVDFSPRIMNKRTAIHFIRTFYSVADFLKVQHPGLLGFCGMIADVSLSSSIFPPRIMNKRTAVHFFQTSILLSAPKRTLSRPPVFVCLYYPQWGDFRSIIKQYLKLFEVK